MEYVSTRLSRCLNISGYKMELIQSRRNTFLEVNRKLNTIWPEYTQITAGSKAEGISKYYESDTDRLIIYNDVKCLERGTSDSNFVVFHMDKYLCSPGYTRLVLSNCNNTYLSNEVKKCLIEQNGKMYIAKRFTESFDEFSEYGRKVHRVDINGSPVNLFRTNGPCVCVRSENMSYDFVAGFKCQSRELLEKLMQRKRTYDWPNLT
jgi:hypothetical protein